MISKTRYKDYDKRVVEYMNTLIDNLVAEYGEARDEWVMTLDMIAQNFEIYYLGYDTLKKEGMFTIDKNGNRQRHPAITLLLNTQSYIQKLITQMGWTLLSKSKIKSPEQSDDSDDVFED